MTNRYKVRIILFWWSRGESNPCPKALPQELLRAQTVHTFPHSDAGRHTPEIGRVMMRGTVNSFRTHGHHLGYAQTRLVVLPGRTAALSSGENYVIVVL